MNALRRSTLALSIATCLCSSASAIDIVHVEEVWSLYVGEPSLNTNGPQVSMVMSPAPNLYTNYFMFYINHRTSPNYNAGGAQVQLMYGDEVVQAKDNPNSSLLDQDEETLQWTQIMRIKNGAVEFEIKDGTSKSWGGFGGLGHLKTSIPTGQSNLNWYSPSISLTQSGVGYAGNRVVSLVLKRITWVTSTGQRYDLHAPIDIDSDLDPWD